MVDAASWTARSQTKGDTLAICEGGSASLRAASEQLSQRFRLPHVGDVSFANHADDLLFLIPIFVEDADDLILWGWL